VLQLLLTANVIPSLLILLTLKMEAIRSSQKTALFIVTAVETSNLTQH
jgi:hypothetical protein